MIVQTQTTKRSRQSGLTLIELMVVVVISLIAALVIQQVMALFESQKRTSSGGSDAQVNGTIALFSLEREIREAGYGLYGGMGFVCSQDRAVIRPLIIHDGGTGPDAIEVFRSASAFGPIPVKLKYAINDSVDIATAINVDLDNGLNGWAAKDDLVLLANPEGGKNCAIGKLAKNSDGTELELASVQTFTSGVPLVFDGDDVAINMSKDFVHTRYQILCNRLSEMSMAPTSTTPPADCEDAEPMVDEVVDLQAQYGVTIGANNKIEQWCNASASSSCTGDWVNPTEDQVGQIRAVRIAVVSRSIQYEKEEVSPEEIELWAADGLGGDDPPTLSLDDDARHYRYKVFSTVVPLRNAIWGSE